MCRRLTTLSAEQNLLTSVSGFCEFRSVRPCVALSSHNWLSILSLAFYRKYDIYECVKITVGFFFFQH